MRKGYFSRIKHYGWILVTCMVLATLIGFLLLKIQPSVFQASSIMFVNAGSPGDNFNPSLSSSDSLGLATDYASEIITRSVMQYVYLSDPELKKRGYGPDDLLADVTATPSATVASITITASALNANDAILLANDVAKGFQSYVQTQRQQQLDALRTNLQNQYNAALKQKSSIEASLLSVASSTDPRFAVYEANLTSVLQTLGTLEAQLVALPPAATSDVVVLHLAGPKDALPTVKPPLLIAVTAGIGLLVGVAIMLLVIFLDNRLLSEAQVSEELGMAYLGGLSKSAKLARNPATADGSLAHELGDIAANLRLTGVLPGEWHAPQGTVLLVTSPQVAEGKTTVATALAATIARGGSTVVVIDGNLHQPATHLSFGMSSAGAGLSGLLRSKGNVDDAVQRSNVPGIWLLPGGAPMDAPTLLLEQKLPALLTQLRKKAEMIIIDGPSLLSGAEAGVLASMSDGVAMVVDSQHDRLPLLLRAKEIVNSLTHTPAGVVMNRFPHGRRNSYFAAAYPRGATTGKNAPFLYNRQSAEDVATPQAQVTLPQGPQVPPIPARLGAHSGAMSMPVIRPAMPQNKSTSLLGESHNDVDSRPQP